MRLINTQMKPIDVRMVTDEGMTFCQDDVITIVPSDKVSTSDLDEADHEDDKKSDDSDEALFSENQNRDAKRRKISKNDTDDIRNIMCDESLWKQRAKIARTLLEVPTDIFRHFTDEDLHESKWIGTQYLQ